MAREVKAQRIIIICVGQRRKYMQAPGRDGRRRGRHSEGGGDGEEGRIRTGQARSGGEASSSDGSGETSVPRYDGRRRPHLALGLPGDVARSPSPRVPPVPLPRPEPGSLPLSGRCAVVRVVTAGRGRGGCGGGGGPGREAAVPAAVGAIADAGDARHAPPAATAGTATGKSEGRVRRWMGDINIWGRIGGG